MSAAHSKWPLPPLPPIIADDVNHGFWEAIYDYARAAQALAVEQDRKARGEPVAWMRADGEEGSISTMTVCISDKVKDLWLKANPMQVERYTVPLYAAPPNIRRLMELVRDATIEARKWQSIQPESLIDLDAIEKAWREGQG
jgi:hypothetical protein